MATINSHCRICGKGYHRCNCHSEGSWRKVTDTSEHYQIFCVIRDYRNGVISAFRAKNLLAKMDLRERDSFVENVRQALDEIEAKTSKKATENSTPKQETK